MAYHIRFPSLAADRPSMTVMKDRSFDISRILHNFVSMSDQISRERQVPALQQKSQGTGPVIRHKFDRTLDFFRVVAVIVAVSWEKPTTTQHRVFVFLDRIQRSLLNRLGKRNLEVVALARWLFREHQRHNAHFHVQHNVFYCWVIQTPYPASRQAENTPAEYLEQIPGQFRLNAMDLPDEKNKCFAVKLWRLRNPVGLRQTAHSAYLFFD